MSAGEQEMYRWWLKSHSHRPTCSVIEAPASDEKDKRTPNTAFGFARILQPKPEAPEPGEPWEGQGL